MQDYWVRQVWHMHAEVDAEERWQTFSASPFFPHIPTCRWPTSHWTSDRIGDILRRMSSTSSPGVRGLPISLWKALPPTFMARVADLLNLVENTGKWPQEVLAAYVTIIPKASGGTRSQNQRPIRVLDVLYRIWAKGGSPHLGSSAAG